MRRRNPSANHFLVCFWNISGVTADIKPMGLCCATFSFRPSSTLHVPSCVSVKRFAIVDSTVDDFRDRVGFKSTVIIHRSLPSRSCIIRSNNPFELNESVLCMLGPLYASSVLDFADRK